MKALSVRQPWAWPIVHGYKNFENRPRDITGGWRGEVLIHASQTVEAGHWPIVRRILAEEGYDPDDLPGPDAIATGGFVGIADIIDVTRISSSPWFVGPVGILLTRARPITLIRWPGQLGLFEVDAAKLGLPDVKSDRQAELFK